MRLMQRSIDQLQTDIRKVTQLGLEAKLLTDKVQHFEVCNRAAWWLSDRFGVLCLEDRRF